MSTVRLALEVLRWGAGTWLLWRVGTCTAAAGAGDADRAGGAMVVVPARDEEDNLPRLLASLAAQDPPAAEVIVVDDGSADATAAVARRAGARVMTAGPLPEGWTGKSRACAKGAEAAGAHLGAIRSDMRTGSRANPVGGGDGGGDGGGGGGATGTLVFLDADTALEPGGLSRLIDEHGRRGGLFSVQPFHVTERAYESLSAFFNLVSMMGVGAFTPRPAPRPTAAFGPCLVCSAADYAATGGHAHPDVRGQVVEDVALARRFTEEGLAVSVLGGRGTVNFRMYAGGIGQLVEGWTKNFASGASSTPPLTIVAISLWLSGCISAAWALPAPAATAVYLAYAGQLGWMLRRIGRFGWWAPLLYPVLLAFFLVVFVRSLMLTHLRGEVRWRGRTISTRATRSTRSTGPARRP